MTNKDQDCDDLCKDCSDLTIPPDKSKYVYSDFLSCPKCGLILENHFTENNKNNKNENSIKCQGCGAKIEIIK